MKVLTFTTLYPNAVQPQHGIFVENRLRHLIADTSITTQVVAPVPWFPFRAGYLGRYGTLARVPQQENRFGVPISHPRYPVIPKVGMILAPMLLYLWSRKHISEMLAARVDFDLIDAHYFYPDGIAAAWLGKEFDKPVVITARGTDINYIPRYEIPKRMIQWAATRAQGIVAVSQALKQDMVALGISPDRIVVLRNGVDLNVFRPIPIDVARRGLSIRGTAVLSVGHLIPRKGHDLVIRAIAELSNVEAMIVGSGPERVTLDRLSSDLGVRDRVHFLGEIAYEEMSKIYSAADVLILASSREGWPNVVLESMACGIPVIASAVGGTPEIIKTHAHSILLPERSPKAIAHAVRRILAAPPSRTLVRKYAAQFDWSATTAGQIRLFQSALNAA